MEHKGNQHYIHNDRKSKADKYESQSNKEDDGSRNVVHQKEQEASYGNKEERENNFIGRDNLMPNPDDFDEGDDEDSEGKGPETPGL